MYWISVTIHVLAAMLWLGGMLFLGAVGAPVLRRVEPESLRQRLFHDLGSRFRTVGWLAIAVLVASGVGNLYYRGLLTRLGDQTFWAAPLGRMLAVKLTVVALMLIIAAVHDFLLGPAAGRARAGSQDARRLRRRAAWLARVNALLAVVLVIAAVRVARGG